MAKHTRKTVSRRVARGPVDVILGEAVRGRPDDRYADMLAIASVIMNRARRLGVTPEQVVATSSRQFDAYDKALPAGVERYREMAARALREVQTLGRAETPTNSLGRINEATFYAAPRNVRYLPPRLQRLGRTTGHEYFADPENRRIDTALGYRTPDPTRDAERVDFTPLYNSPTARVHAGPRASPRWGDPGGLTAPSHNAAWMTAPGFVPYPPQSAPGGVAPFTAASRFLDRTGYLSSPARQSYAIDFLDADLDPEAPGGLLGDRFKKQRAKRR